MILELDAGIAENLKRSQHRGLEMADVVFGVAIGEIIRAENKKEARKAV